MDVEDQAIYIGKAKTGSYIRMAIRRYIRMEVEGYLAHWALRDTLKKDIEKDKEHPEPGTGYIWFDFQETNKP